MENYRYGFISFLLVAFSFSRPTFSVSVSTNPFDISVGLFFHFLGVFFRIFRQVSFSHCVENSNDGIGFSDLWGYATVRLVFRRRFHVAGQTSGCLTRLRHTAPVQLALPQKKRCNFNYVATFLIIHLTELYTKTCYEQYNQL